MSVSDVITDCLVAHQFWVQGRTTFFWLVMASLMLSQVLYTIVGVEILLYVNRKVNTPRVLLYPLVFVLAQLAPVANWVFEQVSPTKKMNESVIAQWTQLSSTVLSSTNSRLLADEKEAVATANKVVERMDSALQRHLRTHLFFYMESVVEAIPQCVVQLVAVTIDSNAATPLQVLSLALSMSSVVSKGYVFTRSFSVGPMVFKFFLGAFDMFSLMYCVATVLSSSSRHDVHIAGTVYMDYMSAIWALKILVWVSLAFLAGLVFLATEFRNICRRIDVTKGVRVALGSMVGLLLSVPLVILAEGAKAIWSLRWITACEPHVGIFPPVAMLYSIVTRKGMFRERCRLLIQHLLAVTTEKKNRNLLSTSSRSRGLRHP